VARSIRMYGKKRGNRRTGSPKLGSLGEALFFSFFLALGTVGLVLLLSWVILPEWRANHVFLEHRATVVQKRVSQRVEADGVTVYRPDVRVRYSLNGQHYDVWTYDITRAYSTSPSAAQAVIDQFDIGRDYVCWVHPDDPETVVLVQGYTWWLWLLLPAPVAFIVIGGGGLIFTVASWGKSQEHRAARQQLALRLALFDETSAGDREFPNVPSPADVTNSPGTRLKYRLPISTRQSWQLFAVVVACLSWNTIVAVFAVMAIRALWTGQPNWHLNAFLAPLVAIGAALVYYVVRQVLAVTTVGPTQLEISDHPLRPGSDYELYLAQGGHLTFHSLEVWLVCEEAATYRQGTDTRTERRAVFEEPLARHERVLIAPPELFQETLRLHIPREAMHSFCSDHNEVAWKLVVRGEVAGWPPLERAFPLVVYPATSA
jgi:hypothetical protein